MSKKQDMVTLGRLGGLKGGKARARSLNPEQRSQISANAAKARWSKPFPQLDRSPRNLDELTALVAYYGSKVSRSVVTFNLEEVVLHAVLQSRFSPNLARMLPVFLWRLRNTLNQKSLLLRAREPSQRHALGYFLELTATLGSWSGYNDSINSLRKTVEPSNNQLCLFFTTPVEGSFEAAVANLRTPPEARKWGLLTGTPTDSFKTYFDKVANL